VSNKHENIKQKAPKMPKLGASRKPKTHSTPLHGANKRTKGWRDDQRTPLGVFVGAMGEQKHTKRSQSIAQTCHQASICSKDVRFTPTLGLPYGIKF